MKVRELLELTSFKFNYFEIKNWDDSWLDSSYKKREIVSEHGDKRIRAYTLKIDDRGSVVGLVIQIEPY